MKTAILIIDMINEYANGKGRIYCKEAPTIVSNLNKLIIFGRKKAWPIIFVNTELSESDTESILVKKWGPQALKNTWSCNVISEIHKEPVDIIVPKTTFDGFYKSRLEEVLKSLNIERVIVTGIHTHVCVHFTAMSAASRGFIVVALEDCMTTNFADNHNSRLRLYKTHIGELYKLEDFLKLEDR